LNAEWRRAARLAARRVDREREQRGLTEAEALKRLRKLTVRYFEQGGR
jgi:hypothetical protein